MTRRIHRSGAAIAALCVIVAAGAPAARAQPAPRTPELLRDLDAPSSGGPTRAGAEQLFGTLLAKFAELEPSIGVPAGDLASATALYVIASYEAYRDASVDPSAYQPVIRQLRTALGTSVRGQLRRRTDPADR